MTQEGHRGAAPGLIENGDLRVRQCRYGLMLYSLKDVYIGRSFELYGEYCEQEVALYKQLVEPGQVIVDAGANIGAHTVFFARATGPEGAVHAFEPQRVIFYMLGANLALNGLDNVHARHAALGDAPGTITVPRVDYGKAGNFGGVSLVAGGPGETVPVMTVDGLALDRCDLIKIDVQGMEGQVLAGARRTIERFRPMMYVENDLKAHSAALIGQLFDLDYRLYWHIPRLYHADNYFGRNKNIFRNTVNVNMLCLPAEDPRQIQLRRITSVEDWWKPLAERSEELEV